MGLLFLLSLRPMPSAAYQRGFDCGGAGNATTNTVLYERDQGYTVIHGGGHVGGDPATAAGTPNGPEGYVMRTERYGMSEYRFDLPNGSYTVQLDFAETWFGGDGGSGGAGSRVFDVEIEGVKVLDDLDIFAVAGAYNTVSYSFGTVVTDRQLNIAFTASVDSAEVRGVLVFGPADGSAPSAPSGLTATGRPFRAELVWFAPPEEDVWGYVVERATALAGAYAQVNPSLVCTTRYADVQVNNGREYFYRVRSVDYAGNTGSPSSSAWATPAVAAPARDILPVPDCAWRCPLGYVPTNAQNHCPDRGVALGGFGAGSFMYSVSGAFGPWALDVAAYFEDWLWEGAFHFYEKVGSGAATALCLSTRSTMLPGWPRLEVSNGTYYALQPRGWVAYDRFNTDVSVEFFSPVIPHNYRESSFPVAVFKWRVSNPSSVDSADIAIMFTWPNARCHDLQRVGFTNFVRSAPEGAGIVLKASHVSNVPETENSEWCIATDTGSVQYSYISSWDKTTGAVIWADFSDDGLLSNGALDTSQSAAAIAAKVTLGPGEARVIPFVLSWDFPVVRFGGGTEWWKRYCEYFGTASDNAFGIACEALADYEAWEQAIAARQEPVVTNRALPDWLKCAAFNELYYSQFGGSFWEAGLRYHPSERVEYRGLHVDDHKNFVNECMAYYNCSPLDVRHYCSIVYALMWPEMERDLLVSVADAIEYFDAALHQTPHDLGSPNVDPYFAFDAYGANGQHWKDLPSRYIQQVWRYYALHRDQAFLDYVWPSVKRTYVYLKNTDTDADFLPNHSGGTDNTYDFWGGSGSRLYGSSSLCGGLWVAALEAMERMAIQQDDDVLPEVQAWLEGARSNLTAELWYEQAGYFRLDTENSHPVTLSLMADALNGERLAQSYGLAPIADTNRIRSSLEQVYDRCVVGLRDGTGDGVGDMGIMNGRMENGDAYADAGAQANEVWGGSTYFLAAMMYRAGLEKEALQAAFGAYYPVYEADDLAYRFNVPEAWNANGEGPRPTYPEEYQRLRAVWELVSAILPDLPYETPLPRVPWANVALGATAAASSVESGELGPLRCIDAAWTSRWSSAASDPQWVGVDLGGPYDVSRVGLHWEYASGKAYTIQGSSNGTDWADLAAVTNGDGVHDLVEIEPPARARHVRMYGTERNTEYGYSLWELEIYGNNLAQGKPATASGTQSSYPPCHAFDGRLDTRWSSSSTDDEWIGIDLGAQYPVDAFILHWEAAFASNYVMAVSTDSNTWRGVYTNAAGDGGIDRIHLASAVTARYVRMVGVKRGTGWGYSLYEMQVYGPGEDTDADGLHDAWEMQSFGTLAWRAGDDPDVDGVNNANEQMIAWDARVCAGTNDLDADGMPNYDESLAGTDPRSASSYLRVEGIGAPAGDASSLDVSWSGISGRTYYVFWAGDVTGSWVLATPGGTNVPTSQPVTWVDDGSGTGGVPPGQSTGRMYRITASR